MKRLFSFPLIVTIFLFAGTRSVQAQNAEFKSPPEADKIANPLKDNATAIQDGKIIFEKYCVACHGKSGKGDGPTAVSLNPRPANFQQKKIKDETDGAIFWKISNGKSGSAMIGWAHSLTADQRWKIVNYIRSLQK